MEIKVLVVDDDETIRNSLLRVFKKEGCETILAVDGEDALKKVKKEEPDIIFLDLRLPKIDGLTVLQKIKEINDDVIVIIISAYGTSKDVVEAMKLSAFDYVQKPYDNNEIKLCLLKAKKEIRVRNEVKYLRASQRAPIIAKSSLFRHVIHLAKEVATSPDTPVLIQGETGTGKQVVAQMIHEYSSRRNGPFLSLNCASIPKELMESELFGHQKGAFTGAITNKQGLLEVADQGTLLLDEIGELSMQGQVKLLHVLEKKAFFKVGGIEEKISTARLIAATNRDLEKEIKENNFREDLFYRLNVVRIQVPPLRERKSDIIPLAKYFLQIFNGKFSKNVKGLSQNIERLFLNYEWPGNVRELKNVMERGVLLAKKDRLNVDFYAGYGQLRENAYKSIVIQLGEDGSELDQINKMLIEESLKMCKGNQVKAAAILGLSRSTMRYKMKRHCIDLGYFKDVSRLDDKSSD